MARRRVGNLLGLALLAFLAAGQPMHPYQMINVLRRTGKERDMKIKIGSLYTVVQNLERHGFIEATGSTRNGRRPERKEYRITAEGRTELRDWLRELLADPEPEYPRFRAALSVLSALPPSEAIGLLQQRLAALEADVAAEGAALAEASHVGRLFLVEGEYALAMRIAEANWVRSLLTELTEGTFPGVAEWQHHHNTGQVSPGWKDILTEGSTAS